MIGGGIRRDTTNRIRMILERAGYLYRQRERVHSYSRSHAGRKYQKLVILRSGLGFSGNK
jgi:hypothetical protein